MSFTTTKRVWLPKRWHFACFTDRTAMRRGHPTRSFTGVSYPSVTLPVDWAKSLSFPMDGNDQYGDCMYCLPPGTLIRLADGTSTPVEDIRVGDEVVTAEGGEGKVIKTVNRHYKGELVNFNFWGHHHLNCTPNHPLLTRRGYVEADKIEKGDWVAQPGYRIGRHKSLKISNFIKLEEMCGVLSESARGYAGSVVAQRKTLEASLSEFPEEVGLTFSFGRLLGLYLAEGSVHNNTIRWTFNANERKTIAKEVVDGLRDIFGLRAVVEESKPRTYINIRICSKSLVHLLHKLCGIGAEGKRLNGFVMGGPREFLEGLFSGWADGDGYRRDGKTIVTTVSRVLAQDMFAVATALGWRPAINNRETENLPVWNIIIGEKALRGKPMSERDGDMTWRRVRSIRHNSYFGTVYNFAVEGAESYVAEGLGVHNCAGCHADNTFTGNNGTESSFDQSTIVKDYLALAGGDNGLDEGTLVSGWKKGLAGNAQASILDALDIDVTNVAAQAAIELFGGILFMLDVPDAWVNNADTGAVWDAPARADQNNGHGVWLNGIDTAGRYHLQTWGTYVWLTPAGVKVCDPSAFVVFSLRWFNSAGIAPNGLNYDQLAALWVQFGGNALPPSPFAPAPVPVPVPVPTPVPPPGPGPVEQTIQEIIDEAFAAVLASVKRPLVHWALQFAQGLVDQWLQANINMAKRSAWDISVKDVVDSIFASLLKQEASRPLLTMLLTMAQSYIDNWLVTNGWNEPHHQPAQFGRMGEWVMYKQHQCCRG